MSVPLPSPSPSTLTKSIPRSRPAPISTAEAGSQGASPSSSSFRRPANTSIARSSGFSLTDENWRTREPPKTAGTLEGGDAPNGNGNGNGNASSKGPERTVGGFDKKELKSPPSSSGIAGSRDKASPTADSKTQALSHVPCRFFKAGACTAGASCPFSHETGGKKEICQWFLKGDCKFGHKCALAHVRPGEPMSMDRKNKKEQQREARERNDGKNHESSSTPSTSLPLVAPISPAATPTAITHPVPIRSSGSVLSPSLQQGGSLQSPSRGASSPMREPYGPPAATSGSPSAGFNRSTAGFASSPSRPSPLSASFGARGTMSGPMSLKAGATVAHSPLRPPPSADVIFSSSFSHAPPVARDAVPLSASFADGNGRSRSIWAARTSVHADRSIHKHQMMMDDVFDDDLDDHGEDLLPSSLSDLLTPTERARRMSRRDSNESFGRSPSSRPPLSHNWLGSERLAQSAGAALPTGYLQGLWNDNGADARRDSFTQDDSRVSGTANNTPELTFASGAPQPPRRQSLLTQRAPTSPFASIRDSSVTPASPPTNVDPSYHYRGVDPSSPNTRALQEHAPGQSLPGGLAAALSRIHMQPHAHAPSILHEQTNASGMVESNRHDMELGSPPSKAHPLSAGRDEHEDEGVFQMDG